MTNKEEMERLLTGRWPKLKKRAQHEENPEKLIAILEEIDDLLFTVEMRIAAQSGRTQARGEDDSRPHRPEFDVVLSDDSETESP
jgi:hypothetical protein